MTASGPGQKRGPVLRWLIAGEWRAHPVRALVAISAIAIGVALGFAIQLINSAAFNEFSAALRSVSGQAELQVRGTQAAIPESLFPMIAGRAGVAAVSPVVEIDVPLASLTASSASSASSDISGTLKILGIDVMRAVAISPDLVGVPAEDRPFDTLSDDTIFLSPAAMADLRVQRGDTLTLPTAGGDVILRVAGGIVRARPGQRIAVMDIGAAQWRFGQLGNLSRIDLTLEEGIDRASFGTDLTQALGGTAVVMQPEDQEARTANMSRAYRVNLNVLALVALFTGAFLVFSTQALSVIRRRQEFALLRVIGMPRGQLLRQILTEGAMLGMLGSALGLAAGYAMAALALQFFGGDLGGGYFPGVQPTVQFSPLAAAGFFMLGTVVAMLGSASPAMEAARAKPAQAIKSGSEDVALSRLSAPWAALVCLAVAGVFAFLPPVAGLPIFGYLAVALLLIGGLALMPRLSAWLFARLLPSPDRLGRMSGGRTVVLLALARLANAPNQASIALGGVLSSFGLMVAMAIMVSSFRVSVDNWLVRLLPADLYGRTSGSQQAAGGLRPFEQRALLSLPGVAYGEFTRQQPIVLDPKQPPVTLLARQIDVANPEQKLPITGQPLSPGALAGAMPVWVSEAMVDLYGHEVGKQITLPVGGRLQPFTVAGIWRDYSRQFGAIQMRLADYQALSGDLEVNDVALWLKEGVTPTQALEQVQRLPVADRLEFAQPGEIRALSLKIFDRSFAVTYLLEGVAIIIGLFGIAATFSAQTFARAKEFGMLRHVGVTRRQILAMLATEGTLLTAIGIAAGFLLGWCISLILVFVVNPQSFHWTMEMHLPWPGLAAVSALLLASAAATALISGRRAASGDMVRAVREDW
jgi:putative ABC transport system permease protein